MAVYYNLSLLGVNAVGIKNPSRHSFATTSVVSDPVQPLLSVTSKIYVPGVVTGIEALTAPMFQR